MRRADAAGGKQNLMADQRCGRRAAAIATHRLAHAHAMIGLAKFLMGRFEETETHVQEAIRLSPRDNYLFAWLIFAGSRSSISAATTRLSRVFDAPSKPIETITDALFPRQRLGAPGSARGSARRGSSGYGDPPRFHIARFRASTASDTRAIWLHVSVYATACARPAFPRAKRDPPPRHNSRRFDGRAQKRDFGR